PVPPGSAGPPGAASAAARRTRPAAQPRPPPPGAGGQQHHSPATRAHAATILARRPGRRSASALIFPLIPLARRFPSAPDPARPPVLSRAHPGGSDLRVGDVVITYDRAPTSAVS